MNSDIQKLITKIINAHKQEEWDNYNNLLFELEDELISFLKKSIIDNKELDYEKIIEDQMRKLYETIDRNDIDPVKNNVRTVISMFLDLEPLRNNGENAISFFQECTQRMVVYDEQDFIDDYEKYNIKDKSSMRDLCSAIKNLYYSHTMNRLSPITAEKQVKELFELPDSVANIYRTLYELNYDKVTMNVILSKLH